MTDAPKHTPGPWTAKYVQGLDYVVDGDGTVIANDVTAADATLIAAAPDLLEVLRDVAKHFDTIEVRRAIAKAEGRDD